MELEHQVGQMVMVHDSGAQTPPLMIKIQSHRNPGATASLPSMVQRLDAAREGAGTAQEPLLGRAEDAGEQRGGRDVESASGDQAAAIGVDELLGKRTEASIPTTAFNIANNLVGSGLLTVPYTFKIVGIPLGLVSLTCAACLAWISFQFVAVLCVASPDIQSFNQMASAGGVPKVAAAITLLLYTFGSLVAFVILACDFFAGKGGLVSGVSRWLVVAVLFVVVLYPSSLLKNLAELKAVSVVSVVFMLAMVAVAGYLYATEDSAAARPRQPLTVFELGQVVPVHIVCFSAHVNAPRFFNEMGDSKTLRRFGRASAIAVAGSWAVYASFGILSVLAYPDCLSDVIQDFPSTGVGPIARCLMLVVVLTTYPLIFFALRGVVRDLVNVDYPILLLLLTAVAGAAFPDIGVVLELKGALLGPAIVFGLSSLAMRTNVLGKPGDFQPSSATLLLGSTVMVALAVVCTVASLWVFAVNHLL